MQGLLVSSLVPMRLPSLMAIALHALKQSVATEPVARLLEVLLYSESVGRCLTYVPLEIWWRRASTDPPCMTAPVCAAENRELGAMHVSGVDEGCRVGRREGRWGSKTGPTTYHDVAMAAEVCGSSAP